MSTETSIARFAGYDDSQTRVVALAAAARGHRITDDVSRSIAADIRAALKTSAAVLEEARTSLVKPLNDHVRTINGKFTPLREALDAAVKVLDVEILRDRKEQQRIADEERAWQEAEAAAARKAAEEEQAARAREIAAQAEVVAKEAGMSPAEAKEVGQLYAQDELAKPLQEKPVAVVEIREPPKTIAGGHGVTTIRKRWTFEVVDIRLVPRAYLALDETIVREAIRQGVRQIDGLRIYQAYEVSGR